MFAARATQIQPEKLGMITQDFGKDITHVATLVGSTAAVGALADNFRVSQPSQSAGPSRGLNASPAAS